MLNPLSLNSGLRLIRFCIKTCDCSLALVGFVYDIVARDNGAARPQRIGESRSLSTSYFSGSKILDRCGNDPSAGSPTETLLRLHLPLNDKV
jgi:hypothetical protein